MKNIWYWDSPVGFLEIAEDGTGITEIQLSNRKNPANSSVQKTPLIERAISQLSEYFAGKRKEFDLPLSLHGTEFQLSDWKALQTIPYGETKSYQQIAMQIGNIKACRAVGMANRNNPIMIVIPCHRVIGKNGNLTGYACGLDIKKKLLELERKNSENNP